MFGGIKVYFRNRMIKIMEQEIKQYIQSIQGMDNGDIACVILHATMARNVTGRNLGVNFLDPIIELENNVSITLKIGDMIKASQRDKQYVVAASFMVWLHTFRSISQPEMRIYGKQLWKELNRGIMYINDNTHMLYTYTYLEAADIMDYHQIPLGLNWSDSLNELRSE
jgi:hypothetical protein